MLNFDCLKKTLTLALLVSVGNFTAQAEEAQRAIPLEEAPQGYLYRLNKKTGEVVTMPLSKQLLEEHNIEGQKVTEEQMAVLAGVDSRGVLKKSASLKAVKRPTSADEFNDADANAKPALYFGVSFGFGRPYWGGYRPYNVYPNYNYAYVNRPYYYSGYYAPRVIYTSNSWYTPVVSPYYYGNYTYSYYSCGGCY